MPLDTVASLVDALRQHRLLEPAQLDELTRSLARRYREPRALARALLERAWLTPYQINQLFQGRLPELVLGQFIILERLGEGPLGQVYKARHQHMKRIVALKVIREDLLNQPAAVEQFYHQVQLISQLSHPHIVEAYDAGPIGRTHFFAMEYVEGIDLERLVQQSGPLPVNQACDFLRQAALGTQHAFERGLLHYDLKPLNLLVTRRQTRSPAADPTGQSASTKQSRTKALLKIRNLGLTVLLPRRAHADDWQGPGTPDFLAPERVESAGDVRSEIYSLGCTFYYLLTGRVPFPGGSAWDKIHRHQAEEPAAIESLRAEVPAEVRAVCCRALAKDPADRYQTPAELAAALLPLRGPEMASSWEWPTVQAPSRWRQLLRRLLPKQLPALPFRWSGRWRQEPLWRLVAGSLLALAALAVLLLLGWYLLGSDPDRPGRPTPRPVPKKAAPAPVYVRRASRQATWLATLEANGLPTFEGKWSAIGPFDNTDKKGFQAVYPPEQEINLTKKFPGKGGQQLEWKPFAFEVGKVVDLKPFGNDAVVYLYHEFTVRDPQVMSISLGSDDTLTVWHNGDQVLATEVYRGCQPDQDRAVLNLKAGKNQLLVKICNGGGDFAFYLLPLWPASLERALGDQLRRDFP
jgi:serine/threonine-protein kinase